MKKTLSALLLSALCFNLVACTGEDLDNNFESEVITTNQTTAESESVVAPTETTTETETTETDSATVGTTEVTTTSTLTAEELTLYSDALSGKDNVVFNYTLDDFDDFVYGEKYSLNEIITEAYYSEVTVEKVEYGFIDARNDGKHELIVKTTYDKTDSSYFIFIIDNDQVSFSDVTHENITITYSGVACYSETNNPATDAVYSFITPDGYFTDGLYYYVEDNDFIKDLDEDIYDKYLDDSMKLSVKMFGFGDDYHFVFKTDSDQEALDNYVTELKTNYSYITISSDPEDYENWFDEYLKDYDVYDLFHDETPIVMTELN